MIKCTLTGRGLEVDSRVRSYVDEKVGSLEKYLPRSERQTASCTVTLEDDPNGREDNRYVCDAVLTVGGMQMVSREGTVNIYAAIDIVEAKLKAQIARHKEKHVLEPRRERMMSRLLGRQNEADVVISDDAPA